MVSAARADKWSRLARASPNGDKLSELYGREAEGLRPFSRRLWGAGGPRRHV